MKKSPKIRVTRTIDEDIKWELDGSLENAIKTLQTYYDNHKDDFENLYLEIDTYYDYGDSYAKVSLIGSRPETDEEYEKRIRIDMEYKERKVAEEKKQYEQLKKKYEP